ncbi:MAG: DNA mismatch repair protein MutS [Planctomycetota bacterium]
MPASEPRKLTPAMRQFDAFKKRHPDCVLLFRMGDFYELFYEDAVVVSRAIGLTLTERSPGQPMAGVPHHQLDNYLRKLVDCGFRVAIADQVQDPREAKGVVERAVTRVITPGTLVDDELLDTRAGGTLAAAYLDGDGVALAALDVSTGAFTLDDAPLDGLVDGLSRLGAAELLIADDAPAELLSRIEIEAGRVGCAVSKRPSWQFRRDESLEAVHQHFGVSGVEGFGLLPDDPALVAAGAVLRYAAETQTPGDGHRRDSGRDNALTPTLAHVRPPRRANPGDRLVLDATSLRALEIERTIRRGDTDGSLVGELLADGRCATAMGRRCIAGWLREPSASAEEIAARHAAVAALVEDRRLAAELREALEPVQDVARIAGRIALGRATPRDLVGLGQSLRALVGVRAACVATPALAREAGELDAVLGALRPLGERIGEACVERPPAKLTDGGLIRGGVDAELDEARSLQRDAGQWLAEYQQRLAAQIDLPSIRVGFNKVFGYYVELSAAQARDHGEKLEAAGLSRKQTLKNAERYVNDELRDFEQRVQTAEARALERERVVFEALCVASREHLAAIAQGGEAIARLDALSCFAAIARRRSWVRPAMVDEPALELLEARHPVLERTLADGLVPNTVALDGGDGRLAIITGPNMAGKSTYIRTAALLVVLAHAGSFVPAASAIIGLADRVCTRVGADDALHEGRSTFMVEMAETAAILNNATERSVVVLDEIGRGTSTLDGLSLAWAIAERLADQRGPRALFATHYHELTRLEDQLPGRVRNLAVRVREVGEEIVFLHHVEPGRGDRSYGVQVARLAGIPPAVVERARDLLATLSVREDEAPPPPAEARPVGDHAGRAGQLGLFDAHEPHPAVDRLAEIRLEELTPLAAFDALRELRALVERNGDGAPA